MSTGQPHPAATVPIIKVASDDPWPDDIVIDGSLLGFQFGKNEGSVITIWNWKTGAEVYVRLSIVEHHTCKEKMVISCIAIYNVKSVIYAKKMVLLL